MTLANEVEGLFGPMPEFDQRAARAIQRGSAFVVEEAHEVLGAALLSPDDKPHQIRWLAVREVARRRGVGSLLMAAILRTWPIGDIEVITFASSIPGGAAARRFYEKFGFSCEGATNSAPDSGPRDLFALRRPHDLTAPVDGNMLR